MKRRHESETHRETSEIFGLHRKIVGLLRSLRAKWDNLRATSDNLRDTSDNLRDTSDNTVTWVAASAFFVKTPNKRVTIYECRPVFVCRCHLSDQLQPPHAFCSTLEPKPTVSVLQQHFLVSWYWCTRQENSANISSDILLTVSINFIQFAVGEFGFWWSGLSGEWSNHKEVDHHRKTNNNKKPNRQTEAPH